MFAFVLPKLVNKTLTSKKSMYFLEIYFCARKFSRKNQAQVKLK